MNSRLYIGNLAPNVSEVDLRDLFSRTGTVTAVELILDPTSGQSRGYAFVTMATPELAAAALSALHSYSFNGRYIVVTEARPPQEPKGLISEGFDLAHESVSRGAGQRDKTRRRSSRFQRPGNRNR